MVSVRGTGDIGGTWAWKVQGMWHVVTPLDVLVSVQEMREVLLVEILGLVYILHTENIEGIGGVRYTWV